MFPSSSYIDFQLHVSSGRVTRGLLFTIFVCITYSDSTLCVLWSVLYKPCLFSFPCSSSVDAKLSMLRREMEQPPLPPKRPQTHS